jgi:CRP-like cAMP-binding protein
VAEPEFEKFLEVCSFAEFRVGERMHLGGRVSGELPISVVLEGCLAIHAPTEYGKYEAIILALIMPSQLIGEFEYLGGILPDRLEIIAIDETKVMSFPGNSLKDFIKTCPVVAHNLAKTILIKQNISNFRLEAVCQTKGGKKIATLLLGFIRIPEWKPAIYGDPQFKREMTLSIMWSIDLLTRYLSCDVRTARDGLVELMDAKLITIQWFDNALTPLTGISTEDVKDLGKKYCRVDERSHFRIAIKTPNRLEEYCGD